MKKTFNIIHILIFSISLVALIMLLNLFIKVENLVHVENFNINKKIYLCEEDTTLGSISIDINVDMPTKYRKTQVIHNIQTELYTALFGDTYNLIEGDSALQIYTDELTQEYRENNVEFAENISDSSFLVFNNLHQLEGFSLLSDEHIYSYGITRFIDFGGAHPMQTRSFYNFDLKTGELITESDIFDEGYQEQLTNMLYNTFLEDIATHNKHELDSIDISGYNLLDIKPNGNFYINDEALCYVFNPYDIGAYYLGETEIILPYSKIKHLMRDKNPIHYLYKNKQ